MMKNNQNNVKKDQFVWSEDLHRKFVVAVNDLGGFDEATPKKILAFMKDEKLTKENVTSHLQKYRLHLKNISSTFMPNQGGSIQFHDNNTAVGSTVPQTPLNDVSGSNSTNSYCSGKQDHGKISSTFMPNQEGSVHDIKAPAVSNVPLTPLTALSDSFSTNSNFNGKRDHGNEVVEVREENSPLMEDHQGYFGNQQHKSQSTCMPNNVGVVQDLVTSPNSCNSKQLPGIAGLRHEITAIRHENHQLRQIVQALKAQQNMLLRAILQRTTVPPNMLTKQ